MRARSSLAIFFIIFFSLVFFSYGGHASGATAPPAKLESTSTGSTDTTPLAPPVAGESPTASLGVTVTGPSNTGAATARIPIEVPPGRKGVAPNLALVYNSDMSNGWVGMGWSLDLGAIQRATRKGLNYGAGDFVFILNGSSTDLIQRGDRGTNYYGEKIERTFSNYYFNSSTGGWEVTAKDGTKYFYGTTSYSRQDSNDPVSGQYRVFKWCLDKVQDTNGNYMTVTYWKDTANGEIYLNRIDYTGNVNGVGTTNYVAFSYEARTDAPTMYSTNSPVVTAYRLQSISVYGNGQFARQYVLGYKYSADTWRSLLASVTEYGSDGVTALPATTFDYTQTTEAMSNTWSNTNVGTSSSTLQWLAGDIDGDGRTDIFQSLVGQYVCDETSNFCGYMFNMNVYRSDGIGYTQTWNGPISDKVARTSTVLLGDFNGDGKTDILNQLDVLVPWMALYTSDGTGFMDTWSGSGFALIPADVNGDGKTDVVSLWYNDDGTLNMYVYTSDGSSLTNTWTANIGQTPNTFTWLVADVNGDGKTDLVRLDNNGNLGIYVYTSDGTGYTNTWSNPNMGQSATALKWLTGDMNGDGRTDIIELWDNNGTLGITVYLSTGTGYVLGWTNPDMGQGSGAIRWLTGDVNGDGMTDIIQLWDNNGTLGMNVYTSFGLGYAYAWGTGNMDRGSGALEWLPGDVNGAGKTGVIQLWDNNGSLGINVYRPDGTIPDLLKDVHNGIGGTTTITYSPSSVYQNTYLPFIVQTVSAVTVNDGNGNVSTTNYSYSGGFFSASDREFRGFEYMAATDPAGTNSETWFYTDDIYKGLPNEQVVTDSYNNIYTWTVNTYQYSSPYMGVSFPYLIQKDDYVCDGAASFANGPGSCKHAVVSFMNNDSTPGYDSFGNVTRKYSYGDGVAPKDERTEYYYDTSQWIVSLPSHTWINDANGVKQVETWFDYYSNGNLYKKILGLVLGSKTDTNNPVISYPLYEYGNVKKVTDARSNTTTTNYDSTYTYPAQISNPLNQTVQKTYDYRYGKPLTETDPNGNATTYNYDPFGRLKNASNQNVGSPAFLWKETYYDGLGRTIKTRAAGPDGQVIVSETVYNTRGQVWRTSLPYFEGARPSCLTNANVYVGCTTYYYDAIGSVTKVTNPDGTYVTGSYMQGTTTLIDANGHQKIEYKDVYGRLTKVEEYTNDLNNPYATTSYVYDVMGNLTDVYDAQNNHTIIHYDPLSRKKDMTDPDMGYWTYLYDANGNLSTQTDAKGQVIQFHYDALNRIYWKQYPSGTDVHYYYDESFSTNSIGRLTTVTDASGTEKFYYDKLGRATTTVKTVDGTDYQIDTAFDELGRIISVTYPDNETVSYNYDSGGNLAGISGYVNSFTGYNALGQVGTITYANGVTTTEQYYPTNNRLYSITTNSPTAGGLQNLSYIYDNAGNISTINDLIDSTRTQNFTYDELNRLTYAQSQAYSTPTITYQYNQIGNMMYNTRVGSYTYGTKPHAVLQAGSNSYAYDANGNMQTRNGTTITYDYDNRATSIGSSVTSVYDFSGQRVKKNSTVYIGKLYECTSGNCIKYIFAGKTRVASKSSNNTFFYHSDHLGSTTVITDLNGNKAQETYYYPFGETRYNSGTATHYEFTGQEQDPETGLYYYGARYYDPVIGRFISPDSVVQNPANPQNLNRYTYVDNNPLSYVDPTGHFFWLAFVAAIFLGAAIGGIEAAITHTNILQGIFLGALSGALFYGVGELGPEFATLKVFLHAAVGAYMGGLGAAMGGGDPGLGMLTGGIAAGIGQVAGSQLYGQGKLFPDTFGYRLFGSTLIGGISGGISAEIYGGDFGRGFATGAETAAIGSLANGCIHDGDCFAKFKTWISSTWNNMLDAIGLGVPALEVAGGEGILKTQVPGVPGSSAIGSFGVTALAAAKACGSVTIDLAREDYAQFTSVGVHEYNFFANVDWNAIPGATIEEKFQNWYHSPK